MSPDSINKTGNMAPVDHNAYKKVSVTPVVENVHILAEGTENAMDVKLAEVKDTGVISSLRNGQTDARVGKEEAVNSRGAEDNKYDSVMTEKAVENANQRLKNAKTTAKFKYDDEIGRVTITIQDAATKEIVKEIPTEEMRKVIEHLHTMRGLLIDEGV